MNDMVLRNSFDARAARARCLRYRRRILDISQQVGALHIGSAYSCTEIVDCIYYGLMRRIPGRQVARHLPDVEGPRLHDPVRDPGGHRRAEPPGPRRSIASRMAGSAAIPTTAIPASRPRPARSATASRWSVGMALAERGRKTGGIIYAVLSDGEVQEGSTWEAMHDGLLARLLQSSSPSSTTTISRASAAPPRPIPRSIRWPRSSQAFGWETVEVDGHDSAAIFDAVTSRKGNKPFMVCAKTTKGKGVSYMENVPIWHYRSPSKKEYEQAVDRTGAAQRHEKHLLRGAVQGGDHQSRRLHRRCRHLAGRQHGEIQPRSIPSASSMSASPSRA